MERLIYFFYIFFQGLLFMQAAIFLTLYFTSRKKELLYYSLFLLLIGANFFISAPTTFGIGDDETVLNSGWYKLINTPLVIVGNFFYVLFLEEFYRTLTKSRRFFFILRITKWALATSLLLFLGLYAAGIHSNLLFNILNIIGIVSGIWLVTIIIREKLPFTQLMAYGFIINLAGTLLTIIMLIQLTQGVKHWLVIGYPLVFVKLGLLGEIFFFTLAIFKKWQQQEKELSLQAIKTELEVEKIKSRISKELHDDIGSTLSGINMYSHLAQSHNSSGNQQAATEALKIIHEATGEVIGQLKDMVWSMEQGDGKVVALLERVKEYAQFICIPKAIEVKMIAGGIPADLEAGSAQTHHIYLIAKEAINNAVKYSNSPSITITTGYADGIFSLSVLDKGDGFDTQRPTDGNGLKNMQKRAEEAGALFATTSSKGQGAEVRIRIKIPQQGIDEEKNDSFL